MHIQTTASSAVGGQVGRSAKQKGQSTPRVWGGGGGALGVATSGSPNQPSQLAGPTQASHRHPPHHLTSGHTPQSPNQKKEDVYWQTKASVETRQNIKSPTPVGGWVGGRTDNCMTKKCKQMFLVKNKGLPRG